MMKRELLSIGPFTIYWYSVLIIIAVLIGIYASSKVANKNGIKKDFIMDLIFYLIPISIIGARLYYVIFNYKAFKGDFLSIFKIWEGGLAIYGAVIASIIFIIIYCLRKKKNTLLTFDTLVPYLILGQAIGRWGNFINREAHGKIVSLAYLKRLHLPKFIIKGMYIDGAYYFPTFFYESLLCFLGFLLLIFLRKKDNFKHPGLLLFCYFIWYGIIRFIIEGMRTDSLYIGIFRVSQIVSIILLLIGLSGLIYILVKKKKQV